MNVRIRDWQDKRVWLVGASSGIGAALAKTLIARGARVAATARSQDALDALVGKKGLAVAADVTQPDALAAAYGRIRAAWGGVDVVVYLAGTYKPQRAWELTVADARRHVEVNLMGVYHLLPLVLPGLLAQKSGAIAIVSSVAGYRGLPKSLVYGPTKAALNNLAESLYLDLNPLGVGVYLINPGFVRTPLTERNDFRMPALIDPHQAASGILRGLAAGRFEIHFPGRFTYAMKALQLLPHRLYFALVRRITRSDRGVVPIAGDALR